MPMFAECTKISQAYQIQPGLSQEHNCGVQYDKIVLARAEPCMSEKLR